MFVVISIENELILLLSVLEVGTYPGVLYLHGSGRGDYNSDCTKINEDTKCQLVIFCGVQHD